MPPYTRSTTSYRYDAFNRRVLVSVQGNCNNVSNGSFCDRAWVSRIVWDGSQELAEAMVVGDSAYAEVDTAHPQQSATGPDLYPDDGRVVYTFGAEGIDRPLSVVRIDYADSSCLSRGDTAVSLLPPVGVTPVWNLSGLASPVEFVGCRTDTDGNLRCPQFFEQDDFFPGSNGPSLLITWMGSLLQDKANPDGTAYRRARYYDYNTGAFTQEDPAGLAAGVNAYGFASGDPVNYDDPFGLCPEWWDGKKCGVVFDGISVSGGWLTWSGFVTVGEYADVGHDVRGYFWTRSTGAGAGTVPDKGKKKSWLPSISIEATFGGSESMDSFGGNSQTLMASGNYELWTAGGSISSNDAGSGYTIDAGVSSPGLPVSFSGQGSKTTILTKGKIPHAPMPPTRVQTDATSAAPN